jgi:hypothetical protein
VYSVDRVSTNKGFAEASAVLSVRLEVDGKTENPDVGAETSGGSTGKGQ